MMRSGLSVVILVLLLHSLVMSQENWINPIQKMGRLGSPLVETTPFVFNDSLYLLENAQRFWEIKNGKPGDRFWEDEVRIRNISTGQQMPVALSNHGFATALVWKGRVYIFAGNYGRGKPWRQITEISMTSSADLLQWTKPVTVLKAKEGEYFFNTAVCRGKDKFILLYETNNRKWVPFTFQYCESGDLVSWKEIPGAVYGEKKYVGGPALYFENGWYYTLYLEKIRNGYETRITRSKNLLNWEDAPAGRPFLTFDNSHKNIPLLDPDTPESNASDAELTYFKGETIIYFTGSDQTTAGDLQRAIYKGKPADLFMHFFR